MNIKLFMSQLNHQLTNVNEGKSLEAVCDLLVMHINANILIEGRDGKETVSRLSFDANRVNKTGASLTLPIKSGELIIGKLKLTRETVFTAEEELAAEIALNIFTVLMRRREAVFNEEKKRSAASVRAVINNLSFSELEAATSIIKALDGSEGLLVAGHIADKLGFTRSVVTGALRKLESSGLLESRSLGMKGTYIRVKNVVLIEELAKL